MDLFQRLILILLLKEYWQEVCSWLVQILSQAGRIALSLSLLCRQSEYCPFDGVLSSAGLPDPRRSSSSVLALDVEIAITSDCDTHNAANDKIRRIGYARQTPFCRWGCN